MLCKLMNTCHAYTACMSPTLNGSSVLERYECGNAIKIQNEIMFNFYPGLPHICNHCVTFHITTQEDSHYTCILWLYIACTQTLSRCTQTAAILEVHNIRCNLINSRFHHYLVVCPSLQVSTYFLPEGFLGVSLMVCITWRTW